MFHSILQTPEAKERLKAAVRNRRKPEEETAKIMKEAFVKVGIDGDYGLGYLRQAASKFRDDPHFLQVFMRFSQFESMVCDEAELSPQEFQAKLQVMRANAMRQQQQHQHRAQMPTDPAERQRILEAARQAQAQMASMTPAQRSLMMRAAQQSLASVRSTNPGMSPQEMSRIVSEKMQELQRLIAESGLSSPELHKALEELHIEVSDVTAAPAPSAAAAPPPAPEGIEDELTMRPTVDRS